MAAVRNLRMFLPKVGGPEVFQAIEEDVADPGPGEIRIKVLTAGVAFADVLLRNGIYPSTPPTTPGIDNVGVVDALGAGVTGWRLGQPVAAMFSNGGYTRYRNVKVGATVPVVPLAEGLDPAEAVCAGLNYVTAHQLLHRYGHAKAGERVLVYGAAGGVGTAVLELSKLAGLKVLGAASKAKHALVTALGGEPFDYHTEDALERVRRLPEHGVDIVLDPVGGEAMVRSFKCLLPGGRLLVYGINAQMGRSRYPALMSAAKQLLRIAIWNALPNGKTARFYDTNGLGKTHPEWIRDDLAQMAALLKERKIRPHVAERIPLRDVARAHALLESGKTQGKIVLMCQE